MYLQKYEICSFGEILDDIDHHSLFLGHLCSCITALLAAIVSFKSVPLAMFCESDDPCSCPRFFFKQYDKYCEVTAVSEEVRVCEERSDELKRRAYWILTCMVDTSVRNVAAAKLYADINNTNDPSIATRFARRRC